MKNKNQSAIRIVFRAGIQAIDNGSYITICCIAPPQARYTDIPKKIISDFSQKHVTLKPDYTIYYPTSADLTGPNIFFTPKNFINTPSALDFSKIIQLHCTSVEYLENCLTGEKCTALKY